MLTEATIAYLRRFLNFSPALLLKIMKKKETPKNILYTEKTLPKSQKEKSEFYEEEYTLKEKPNSYLYYIPKERLPASISNKSQFLNWPTIETTHTKNEKALLVK